MRMRRRPQQARRNVNQMATAAVADAVSLSLSLSVLNFVVGRYKFRILSHRVFGVFPHGQQCSISKLIAGCFIYLFHIIR